MCYTDILTFVYIFDFVIYCYLIPCLSNGTNNPLDFHGMRLIFTKKMLFSVFSSNLVLTHRDIHMTDLIYCIASKELCTWIIYLIILPHLARTGMDFSVDEVVCGSKSWRDVIASLKLRLSLT